MSVPAEIAGLGPTSQKPRVASGFDPMKAGIGPDEYFLFSRIDGALSVREIILNCGLPIDRAIAIVQRLRSLGALLMPGETAPPPPSALPRVAPLPPRTTTGTRPASPVAQDPQLPNPTPEEQAALAEDVELEAREKRRILALDRLLAKNDAYMLLGVSQGADAKTLKRAYFLLSKEIHPDRFYGKRLGSFGPRMTRVFEEASRAYARLTTPQSSRGSASHHAIRSPQQEQPQTPQEYAQELFDRACQLEVGGDAMSAMKLFAACVRMAPQVRYLRRATSCALAAGQPRTAVEYAQKAYAQAPSDVSSARLLATAFRAAGKLGDAEEVLVMAMAMKSENDVLTSELRHDLAEVRRMLAQT